MLTHPTQERLTALGLTGMAKALEEQRRQPDLAALAFEERLALLVDREAIERENKRLVSRLKFAGLRQNAAIEACAKPKRNVPGLTARQWPDLITNVDGKRCPEWSDCCPASFGILSALPRTAVRNQSDSLSAFVVMRTVAQGSRVKSNSRCSDLKKSTGVGHSSERLV
jgi:hypothetical protein